MHRIRAFLRVCSLFIIQLSGVAHFNALFCVGSLIIFNFMLQIRLRDYGVLDFDAGDARRQPPVDTTWQQVMNASSCIPFSILVVKSMP